MLNLLLYHFLESSIVQLCSSLKFEYRIMLGFLVIEKGLICLFIHVAGDPSND